MTSTDQRVPVAERRYRLAEDAEFVATDDGEVLVGRPSTRHVPQLLSTDAARLVEEFRASRTVEEAVLAYCRGRDDDPLVVLDAAFGVLVALTASEVLVTADAATAGPVPQRCRTGDRLGPAVVGECLRRLHDSEIWRAELADATSVIVKIVDQGGLGRELFDREIAALGRLAGSGIAPRLFWHQRSVGGGAMVLEEIGGSPVDLVARGADQTERRRLAGAVVDAYAELHAHGVRHGDVHPGNVLATDDGGVRLIDFGLAEVEDGRRDPAPRPSGGEYLDPQAAAALLAGRAMPGLTSEAEQYAVAAVAYRVITGVGQLDLDRERPEALAAIVAEPPRPFAATGVSWPAGERVLRRGLAKDPRRRYPDLAAFRSAFDRAARQPMPPPPATLTDLAALVDRFEVTGRLWREADERATAHAARLLTRLAERSGDVAMHDLADLWILRSAT